MTSVSRGMATESVPQDNTLDIGDSIHPTSEFLTPHPPHDSLPKTPRTPSSKASPRAIVKFTDIRSGLSKASLSTDVDDATCYLESPKDLNFRDISKSLCSPSPSSYLHKKARMRKKSNVEPGSQGTGAIRRMQFSSGTLDEGIPENTGQHSQDVWSGFDKGFRQIPEDQSSDVNHGDIVRLVYEDECGSQVYQSYPDKLAELCMPLQLPQTPNIASSNEQKNTSSAMEKSSADDPLGINRKLGQCTNVETSNYSHDIFRPFTPAIGSVVDHVSYPHSFDDNQNIDAQGNNQPLSGKVHVHDRYSHGISTLYPTNSGSQNPYFLSRPPSKTHFIPLSKPSDVNNQICPYDSHVSTEVNAMSNAPSDYRRGEDRNELYWYSGNSHAENASGFNNNNMYNKQAGRDLNNNVAVSGCGKTSQTMPTSPPSLQNSLTMTPSSAAAADEDDLESSDAMTDGSEDEEVQNQLLSSKHKRCNSSSPTVPENPKKTRAVGTSHPYSQQCSSVAVLSSCNVSEFARNQPTSVLKTATGEQKDGQYGTLPEHEVSPKSQSFSIETILSPQESSDVRNANEMKSRQLLSMLRQEDTQKSMRGGDMHPVPGHAGQPRTAGWLNRVGDMKTATYSDNSIPDSALSRTRYRSGSTNSSATLSLSSSANQISVGSHADTIDLTVGSETAVQGRTDAPLQKAGAYMDHGFPAGSTSSMGSMNQNWNLARWGSQSHPAPVRVSSIQHPLAQLISYMPPVQPLTNLIPHAAAAAAAPAIAPTPSYLPPEVPLRQQYSVFSLLPPVSSSVVRPRPLFTPVIGQPVSQTIPVIRPRLLDSLPLVADLSNQQYPYPEPSLAAFQCVPTTKHLMNQVPEPALTVYQPASNVSYNQGNKPFAVHANTMVHYDSDVPQLVPKLPLPMSDAPVTSVVSVTQSNPSPRHAAKSSLPTVSGHVDNTSAPLMGHTVKTKPPKPKHFPMQSVTIGSFFYTDMDRSYPKVKIIFSRRRLVYEMEWAGDLVTCEDGGRARMFCCIEIPLSTIVGLRAEEHHLLLEVNAKPFMFMGSKPCDTNGRFIVHKVVTYKRQEPLDLTNNQLSTIPYHEIVLSQPNAGKLVDALAKFDKSLEAIALTELAVDRNKRLPANMMNIYRTPVMPATSCKAPADEGTGVDQHSLSPHSDSLSSGPAVSATRESGTGTSGVTSCSCKAGCQYSRCGCVQRFSVCTMLCACLSKNHCHNPVNEFYTTARNSSIADMQKDLCLLANVFKVQDLGYYLCKQVTLPCCNSTVSLETLVPGKLPCPNAKQLGCIKVYQYSWCTGKLHDESLSPRNHCVECGCCTDCNAVHCRVCKKCYVAQPGVEGSTCAHLESVGEVSSTSAIDFISHADTSEPKAGSAPSHQPMVAESRSDGQGLLTKYPIAQSHDFEDTSNRKVSINNDNGSYDNGQQCFSRLTQVPGNEILSRWRQVDTKKRNAESDETHCQNM